jgi:hypothetical protein
VQAGIRRDDTLRGTVAFEHDDAHRLTKVRFANGATTNSSTIGIGRATC